MDSDKQPTPTEAGGPASDVDESRAAEILNAAAASKPADAAPASAVPAPASRDIASPEDIVNAAKAEAGTSSAGNIAPSPTAPSPAASAVPDSPTPNLGNSTGVLGAAPGGMVSPKKSKKGLIGGIIAILLVVILGGSAAAYYQIMNKPQNVLDMALQNSFSRTKASSVDFEGSLDIKPKDSNTYSTTFTGSSDASSGALSLNAKIDAMVTTVNVDLRTSDGKTLYLRLGGLDGISNLLGMGGAAADNSADAAELSFLAPAISAVNNQWIQINQSMIQQLTGSKDNVTTKLSTDDLKKISDAYKKNRFMVVSKSFKDEAVKGKNSKHYQVTVDKTKLKNFVSAVKAANIAAFKSTLTSDTVTQLNKGIDGVDFSKYPVDIWISKGDKMIDQLAFSVNSDGNNVHVRYTVDDYNKPVHVTVPSNAKSFLDILSQVLGGSGANGSSLDSLTDGSGISL